MLSGLLGAQSWLHIISCLITGFLTNNLTNGLSREERIRVTKTQAEARGNLLTGMIEVSIDPQACRGIVENSKSPNYKKQQHFLHR